MPDELDRIRNDIAIIQRALGLRLSVGKEMLSFGLLLAVTATTAAVISSLIKDDRMQMVLVATIMVVGSVGIYLRSRRTTDSNPEISRQVMLSLSIYGVVWVAGCGYAMAMFADAPLGAARTAGLYGVSLGLLLAFSLILIRAALTSRERYYCLGLAISTALAGMLLPLLGRHYSFPLVHGLMAVGFLAGFAMQWVQSREAVADHATD